MRKQEMKPPIVFSDRIASVLKFVGEAKRLYNDSQEYLRYTNDATQDLLHTIELCIATVPERNKIYNQLSEIRQTRRIAKNQEAILSPLIVWIKDHERDIKSLEQLLGVMRKIEDGLNAERYYRSRTGVVENLFGGLNVLDEPAPAPPVPVPEKKIPEPIPEKKEEPKVPEVHVEEPQKCAEVELAEEIAPQSVEVVEVKEFNGDELIDWTLQYPCCIFFIKKKRAGTYYYTFPGLEPSSLPHAFAAGDRVINLRNKKLLRSIDQQLGELLAKYPDGAPYPIDITDVDPSVIRHNMKLDKVSESKVIGVDFKCKCKKSVLRSHYHI